MLFSIATHWVAKRARSTSQSIGDLASTIARRLDPCRSAIGMAFDLINAAPRVIQRCLPEKLRHTIAVRRNQQNHIIGELVERLPLFTRRDLIVLHESSDLDWWLPVLEVIVMGEVLCCF